MALTHTRNGRKCALSLTHNGVTADAFVNKLHGSSAVAVPVFHILLLYVCRPEAKNCDLNPRGDYDFYFCLHCCFVWRENWERDSTFVCLLGSLYQFFFKMGFIKRFVKKKKKMQATSTYCDKMMDDVPEKRQRASSRVENIVVAERRSSAMADTTDTHKPLLLQIECN